MKIRYKLFFLYMIMTLLYAIWIHLFSIPVHFDVDEELYISMAKSFHYTGSFVKQGQILDYSCVLYSMILSVAYYIYSPENIMFCLRIIGVVIMLSSVFPIYLLANQILHNEKKAFLISVVFCFLPSVTNVAYCMQEVLSYPLFLWLVYFVHVEVVGNQTTDISKNVFFITILSSLCYFTKTYMIFFPIVYCCLIFIDTLRKRKWNGFCKIFLFLIGYCVLYLLGKRMILMCNQGMLGENHYAGQFSHLFPITKETVIAAITCSAVYAASLLFYWGFLPILLPIFNIKRYDEKRKIWILFIFSSIVLVIAEIVISIVLTEEGNVLFPHKVLYRYFQIFEMPILLIFLEDLQCYKYFKWFRWIYVGGFGILITYFICIGKNQKTAIIDAPLFLLMENINRYIIPHFNLLVCFFSIMLVMIAAYINYKGQKVNLTMGFMKIASAVTLLFFLINMVQLPVYTNVIAKGDTIQAEAVRLVNRLDEDIQSEEKVYFRLRSDTGYARALFAYLPTDINYIDENENVEGNALIIEWNQEKGTYEIIH